MEFIVLFIVGLIIFAGIIRIYLNPYKDFGTFLLELFWLDILWDLLIAIISSIGNILDSD